MANKKTELDNQQAMTTLQQKLQAAAQKKIQAEKDRGAAYMTANKKRAGITELPNGLQYEVLKAGDANGVKPRVQDTVVVHYKGMLTDGTEFDGSEARGVPASFPLQSVIKGWTEILQHMTVGSKWRVYIPSDLAYGDRGAGQRIPPGATLVFDINLLEIKPGL